MNLFWKQVGSPDLCFMLFSDAVADTPIGTVSTASAAQSGSAGTVATADSAASTDTAELSEVIVTGTRQSNPIRADESGSDPDALAH